MRFYSRIAPNLGVSFGFGLLIFGFFVWLGVIWYALIGLAFVVAMFVLGYTLAFVLMIYGIIYKKATGKDAQVPVAGSAGGTQLEFWMEDHGWIKLPASLRSMTHTQIMLNLYGESGLRRKQIKEPSLRQ